MSYKLSKKADADFKKIYRYTYKNHGELQANEYTDSLENCFLLIFENQNVGRTATDISKGLFRHEHQEHIIFYESKTIIFLLYLYDTTVKIFQICKRSLNSYQKQTYNLKWTPMIGQRGSNPKVVSNIIN